MLGTLGKFKEFLRENKLKKRQEKKQGVGGFFSGNRESRERELRLGKEKGKNRETRNGKNWEEIEKRGFSATGCGKEQKAEEDKKESPEGVLGGEENWKRRELGLRR